MVEKKK